ncbi:MAG: hypothetical protein ACRYGF_01310 [Janthinobacterium lividum]
MANNQDLESGARQVEAAEHMNSGLTETRNLSGDGDDVENGSVATKLGDLTLSMFQQGSSVRVRVGSATASAELYEHAYESADEANTAMLDAGILTGEQVPDVNTPAGTGIHLTGITAEQLLAAGLKRHGVSTL